MIINLEKRARVWFMKKSLKKKKDSPGTRPLKWAEKGEEIKKFLIALKWASYHLQKYLKSK